MDRIAGGSPLSKRILVVDVNWVGDVLFSTPFLQALRENFPESFIASLVVPRCREVLEGNPHLNVLLIYDEKGKHRSFLGKIRLIRLLRKERFDQVYLLHRSFTRRVLVFLSGIPERIGYAIKWNGFFLTEKVPVPTSSLHKVDYFLGLLPQGSRITSRDYTLNVGQEDRASVAALLAEKGVKPGEPFLVFCPAGNWDQKRWPPERFAALGDELIRCRHEKIVITGEARDLSLAEKIASLMKEKPVILCGKTSLKQLAALLKSAALVVSNDTGAMHVAQSQGTKVIALFGPTDPRLTGPSGTGPKVILRKEVGCNDDPPCYYVDCPDTICMKAIQVEDVLDAVQKRA